MYHVDNQPRPQHPRRPPAHQSVSLLHSSCQSPVQTDQSTRPNTSPSSVKPVIGKDDSGESSNADGWFDKSNNHVTARVDNDPPFFLQQSSSEEKTPPQGRLYNQPLPLQTVLRHQGTDGSSTDDYRGVIDDLTVENKKLKRRLKQYERLHDAHLKDDKLFEVRVHGLPTVKKKELEEMLRTFALGLQNQSSLPSSTTNQMYEQLVPALKTQKTNATNASHLTDSAYASLSASGQGSSSATSQPKPQFKSSVQSRKRNIHSYLHDIPETLLPRHDSNMSEKSKKKLVVRRLEQIFAGKGASQAAGAHHHPIQQQEVSRLAAKADRSATEAAGQQAVAEGNREARIMRDDKQGGPNCRKDLPKQPTTDTSAQGTAERDFASNSLSSSSPSDAPEQRPTRPLDLDPQRAQVPFDNIEYIRHLGFSPPDAYANKSPEEDHGWIYLNLLINMAQLHTISVTPEFVKQALQEYSTRFELSSDGRKVRWKRSSGHTRASSDADDTASGAFTDSTDCQSPRKRMKRFHNTTDYVHDQRKRAIMQDQQAKLVYTPLFFHQRSSEDSDVLSSDDEEVDSPYLAPQAAGDSSGVMASSSGLHTDAGGHHPQPKRNRKLGHGPIIFYNNARFCTDLSGEPKTESTMVYNPIMYHVATPQAVGGSVDTGATMGMSEKKGPLNDSRLPEPMDLSDNPIPMSMELNFPPQTPMTSGSEKSPLDMEVSGIGGVYPADNFAINVRTRHTRTHNALPGDARHRMSGRYPSRLSELLSRDTDTRHNQPAVHKQVLSTRQNNMAPSELPPASCFISVDESEFDDESDNESIVSIPIDDPDRLPPSAAPQPLMLPPWDSDESANDDDEDDDDDDDASEASLDFLATARAIDPESIRARELEYDANMAERLAEEIPAGSSARTAGGGSGFASPASGVDPDEIMEAYQARVAAAPMLSRQASDSMVVNGENDEPL